MEAGQTVPTALPLPLSRLILSHPCCSASTGNTLISFILTSTSGDADLYVSNSAFGNVRPTATTPYCAFSTSDSRDVVEIWPNTTCYCTAPCAYGGGGGGGCCTSVLLRV